MRVRPQAHFVYRVGARFSSYEYIQFATGFGRFSLQQKARTTHLEHLECSHQPHIQGRGAEERTQRAG